MQLIFEENNKVVAIQDHVETKSVEQVEQLIQTAGLQDRKWYFADDPMGEA